MSHKSRNDPLKSFKITMYFLATALLLLFIILFITTNANAATITVDDDGNAEYTQIQHAIENATSGDTIRVWDGTYYENVEVDKTLTLIGNGSETTIINGDGSDDVVRITANWVNLSGFSVTGNSDSLYYSRTGIEIYSENSNIFGNDCSNNANGIYLIFSSDCTIENNTCSSNNDVGISLYSSSSCTIDNNICSNNRYGIFLYSSYSCTITNNTMNENSISIDGSLEHWASHIIKTTNKVNEKPVFYYKNATDFTVPFGAGQVILANCTGIIVKDQNCSNGSVGILIGYSFGITLENNTCSGKFYSGIYLKYSENCTLMNNTCSSIIGIILDHSSNCTLENNICENGFGIFLFFSNANFLTNNTCTSNLINGIVLSFSSHCTLYNNRIENGFGIDLHNSSSCILRNNSMNENGIIIDGSLENWTSHIIETTNTVNGKPVYYYKNVTGFTIASGAGQVILANCTWMHVKDQNCSNGSVGILVGYSSNIIISNNTCASNIISGIRLVFSSNCTIENNTCSSNDIRGISLMDSRSCIIKKNICSSNTDFGIMIRDSDENGINNNTITGNKCGIYIEKDSKKNSIHYNRIFDNYEMAINATDNDGILINATHNHWGSDTGPYHPTRNPDGKGNNVSDDVHFRPWLSENGTVNMSSMDYPEPPVEEEDREDDDMNYRHFVGIIIIATLGFIVVIIIKNDLECPLLERKMTQKKQEGIVEQQSDGAGDGEEKGEEEI